MSAISVSSGQLADRARSALRAALAAVSPGLGIDAKAYVGDVRDNLLPGVVMADIEADFRQGAGNELEGKFRAAHSSSALAANTFAPFKKAPQDVRLIGESGFASLHFERQCPHGLEGRRAPNLDVVFEGASHVLGVESKCLEYFTPHTADFADAYETGIRDARRDGPWFAHMQALRANPKLYRWLDAAQLVKHAFGLAHTFPGKRSLLLYLFWEPRNAGDHALFQAHREEAQRFADAVAGGTPSFAFMPYSALWRAWTDEPPASWVAAHVERVRTRYDVEI